MTKRDWLALGGQVLACLGQTLAILTLIVATILAAYAVFGCVGCAGGGQSIETHAPVPTSQPSGGATQQIAAAQAIAAQTQVTADLKSAITGVQYSSTFGAAGVGIAALLSFFCWLKHRDMAKLLAGCISSMTRMFEVDNER